MYFTHTVHIFTINTSTKNALNETGFMTGTNLLHVLAPECHPQGLSQITGIQAQHADLGLRLMVILNTYEETRQIM
jgi:hypothetical protein